MTAVAFAAWLLPLGVAYAQNPDVRAVAERLERAVKAGEMSKDQMDAVLRMLKQPQGRANKDKKVKKRRDASPDVQKMIDDTRRRVRELVEAGEMTRAEAGEAMEKRIAAIKKRAGSAASKQRDDKGTKKSKRRGAGDAMEKMKAEHEALYSELIEMVKAGKLSREDMQRKVEAHRRGISEKMRGAEKKGDKKADPSKDMVRQRLERAVESGDLTEEQAKQRYMEWEKRSGGAKKGEKKSKDTPDRRWQRLEQAVKNGDMTEAEAKQKYAEWEKGAKAKTGSDKKNQSKRKRNAKDAIDPGAMRARLGEAVERGVMTKEQAKQRWEAFQKEMGQEKAGGKEKQEGKRRRRTPKRDDTPLSDAPLLGNLFRGN